MGGTIKSNGTVEIELLQLPRDTFFLCTVTVTDFLLLRLGDVHLKRGIKEECWLAESLKNSLNYIQGSGPAVYWMLLFGLNISVTYIQSN